MKIFILILFLLSSNISFSQSYTKRDLKLIIDNYVISDSIKYLKLTKEELLKTKRIYTNLSWSNIKSITAFITDGKDNSEIHTKNCSGAEICSSMKEYFKKFVKESATITFTAEVVNTKGQVIEWNDLSIVITK